MNQENKEKITLDELAIMIGKGFNEAKGERNEAKGERNEIKTEIGILGTKQIKLEENQEEIKLKLDRVAYTFEVRDLEKRVNAIEEKLRL